MSDFPHNCSRPVQDEQLVDIKLFKEYPDGLVSFTVVCCVLYMLVGIPGNLITIIALARCKKNQNATTAFIMNLACSDMLFCCFNLPMVSVMHWQRSWPLGITACRLFPVAGYGLVAVSLFTILTIMINRYVLIAHPRLYPGIYKTPYIALMIASIWCFSFGFLIPTWFEKWGRFGMNPVIGSCSILPDCNGNSPKRILFVAVFLIPCLLVLICYLRIFYIVRKSGKRCSSTGHKKILQQKREVSMVSVTGSVPSQSFPNPEPRQKILLTPSSATFHSEPFTSTDFTLWTDGQDKNNSSNEKNGTQFGKDTLNRFRQSFLVLKRNQQHLKGFQPSLKDRKLLQTITTIIVSFWVCYLPITFIKLFHDVSVPPVPKVIGYLLVYLTTCINPIIYVVMSTDYRQAYKSLFICDAPDCTSRTMESKISKNQKIFDARIHEGRKSHELTAV